MSDSNLPTQPELGGVINNAYGEHCLFAINRGAFQNNDASTVFRTYFGESIFKEDTFYVIAGTDSGLLYQYIRAQGAPKGSRYLFVELPQILELLVDMNAPEENIATSTLQNWHELGTEEMDMQNYALHDRFVLIRSLGVVHGHYGEYHPFWRQLNEQFGLIKQSYIIGLNNIPFTIQQLRNLTENQVPQIFLQNTFQGKTAVILAGGPSLNDLLPWVRNNRKNLLVIAVARISKSLLEANIQPDICAAVDPYNMTVYLNMEMHEFQDGTLLANEYHVNSILLSSWGGKKVFSGPRYPWPSPLNPENIPAAAGGTVTNSAFAIAVEAGASQIILGGVDFCFSHAGHTHSKGSEEHSKGSCPMSGDTQVKTNSGKMAHTRNDLLNSAQSVESQAKEAVDRGCRVINPSPNSIQLANVEHISLEAIEIEPLEKPAVEIINDSLPDNDDKSRILHYEEVQGEVDRILAELRTVKRLCVEALSHNSKLFNKHKKGASFTSNAKLDSIEKKLEEKYADTVKLIKLFGLRRLVFTLNKHEQNKEKQNENDLKENTKYYFLSLLDTAKELIDHLQQARSRTLSRLEEEKPQPNIEILIEQWRSDDQPGRARLWAERHKDYVNQLPETQKQALDTFLDTFDDSIEKHGKEYIKSIEWEARLEGLNARAREYFQHNDEEGLIGLEASLEQHNDAEQAMQLNHLVRGYLAELRGDTGLAIKNYQEAKGPAEIDALQSLFKIYATNQDMDSVLDVLKNLSSISPTYTAMYAEMLNATGDVDNAVEIYTDYLLDNPDDLNSVMKLGQIYYQHGSTDGVEWAMNYILSKDPDNQTAKAMLESLDQSKTIN